jgi:hypothetical protein
MDQQPFKRISQGTLYWKTVREFCGITASEVADLFRMGYGSPYKRFTSKIGDPDNDQELFVERHNNALLHGHFYEAEARIILENIIGQRIQQLGIFLHPEHGFDVAGSPDGYIEESKTLVEIKCPYFILGEDTERKPHQDIKLGYLIQMIVLMEVMECKDALFMSYAVNYPGGNNSWKIFKIQRQHEIWKKFLEPEILNFLNHVKSYYENPSVGRYKGASTEKATQLMLALQSINKIKIY